MTPVSRSTTPPAGATNDAVVELCAFRVGDEEYVIDLRRLREIMQPLPITPVPRAPEFLDGVMNLRGDVIPVIDVRKRLGITPKAGGRTKILIINIAGRVLGLVVDAVSEVVRLPRSAIGPPPPLLAATAARLFLGVCGARELRPGNGGHLATRSSPRLRLLLNVKALFEPAAPEWAAASRRVLPSSSAPSGEHMEGAEGGAKRAAKGEDR